jgi:hypothetical protein
MVADSHRTMDGKVHVYRRALSRFWQCAMYFNGRNLRVSTRQDRLALARAEEMGRKAQALQAMQRTLLDLAERCHGDGRPDCPILDELASG